MTRVLRSLLPFLALLCVVALSQSVSAQTYNPKVIRFEGSPGLDSADLLRVSGLPQGVPLTKAEIEAGLQKLADTGSFTTIGYTVNDAALIVELTTAAGAQTLPVRFTNFVWWQPDVLLSLVEARVPLFHGQLPLTGSLTDQVEVALVDLLREKGVPDAHITAMQSTSKAGGAVDSIALSISAPRILLGETRFDGALPALTPKLSTLGHRLAGEDFDRIETAQTVRESSAEIFKNAGYLDIANDAPVFSAPRKDLDHYVVDEQVTFHPGELYRIASIALQAAPPLTAADLRSALTVKSGDAASASELRLAEARLTQPYRQRAYLLAAAEVSTQKNGSAHTVEYNFTFTPGDQYRFAAIDTSALPIDLQTEFAKSWHGTPGALMDQSFHDRLFQTLRQLHATRPIFPNERMNNADHTVTISLRLAGASMPHS